MRTGIVKLKDMQNMRFDASFHMSDGVQYKRIIFSSPYKSLQIGDVAERIFYGLRANRIYVKNKNHAIPFMTGANIMLSDLNKNKLVSKKYTPSIEEMTLHPGWILVTRSGTVGQTAWSNKLFEGKYGSEDIIRIVPNGKMKGGLIYAYLASKYGNVLLTQGSFGAVIQHIEPTFVSSIIIPDFPESFQQKVDNLIQESARLREEATEALEEAHDIIEENFEIASEKKSSRVSIQSITSSHNKRFEAFYHTSSNRSIYDYITSNCEYKTLGELTANIFRPGIFKREYVANGVTFLGGADILMAIPDSDKKLSFRQVEKIPELKVKKNWILVTCGGTIGNTVLIDAQLEKCVVSQHVMRIVPKDDILKGYLYAVLSSKIGKELITMFTTGSVIPQIEAHHLELVPIPLFDIAVMKKIDDLVSSYVSKIEISKEKEIKAIQMVEEEIESWSK